jgi:hypothetical protein
VSCESQGTREPLLRQGLPELWDSRSSERRELLEPADAGGDEAAPRKALGGRASVEGRRPNGDSFPAVRASSPLWRARLVSGDGRGGVSGAARSIRVSKVRVDLIGSGGWQLECCGRLTVGRRLRRCGLGGVVIITTPRTAATIITVAARSVAGNRGNHTTHEGARSGAASSARGLGRVSRGLNQHSLMVCPSVPAEMSVWFQHNVPEGLCWHESISFHECIPVGSYRKS